MKLLTRLFLITSLLASLSPLLYPLVERAAAASIFYVSLTGSDGNACISTAAPCATINAALAKSAAGDTIKVALGTYQSTGDQVVLITKNTTLLGGWNSNFSSQIGMSVLDGENARRVARINGEVQALLQRFTVENGRHPGGGAGILNEGVLTIQYSLVRNNTDENGCWGGGIMNLGTLTVETSTLSGNTCTHTGSGGAIYSWQFGGPITIIGSTFENNRATMGGGVMQNTILADNIASHGQIGSAGYNILGSSMGCTFSSASSDMINVHPLVGPLNTNGGKTQTHALYTGSPAIDAGDPAGCRDSSGSLLVSDQRGSTRSADGNADGISVCDIGAFEAAPGELLPYPYNTWYVARFPLGKDTADCLSPATPCATISAALAKAISGDTILVATGVYSSSQGDEVVRLDKNISLSGGWRSDFVSRSGLTIIDGSQVRRGVTIMEDVIADISRVNIQNGLVINKDGGGMYIGFRARVSLVDSLIQANTSKIEYGNTYQEANGGGIAMNNYVYLVMTNCQVINNSTVGIGGGIFSGDSTLIVNNSLIGGNIGGGISNAFAGEIELNDSSVVFNIGDQGGGIRASVLRLKNSLVWYNRAYSLGGGIFSHKLLEIEDSLIAGNKASTGGGIYSWHEANIINSSVILNSTTYGSGGGIISGGNMNIVNTTISYNRATMPFSNDAEGGGIMRVGGDLKIYSATITGNHADRGGGVWHGGEIFLRNTILAGNQGTTGPNCIGTVRSEGYNLIGKTNSCDYRSAPGDQLNVDPKMGYPYGWPLAISLRPGSPAIDAGNPAGCTDHLGNLITLDQIGYTRSIDGDETEGAYCDIGAFEYDPQRPILAVFLPFASSRTTQ